MYVVLKSWMLKTNWRIKSERSWRPKSWREGPHTLPIIDSWIDYYFINYFNVITTPSYLYACYSCDCYLWPWLMHSRFDKSNFDCLFKLASISVGYMLMTFAFVIKIPQILKIYQEKSTEGIVSSISTLTLWTCWM